MHNDPQATDQREDERFEREAIFPASPALTARRLREKAPHLWPASPEVQPCHLTNFILAHAAEAARPTIGSSQRRDA